MSAGNIAREAATHILTKSTVLGPAVVELARAYLLIEKERDDLLEKLNKPVELPAMTPWHLTDKDDEWNQAIGQCAVAVRVAGFNVAGDEL